MQLDSEILRKKCYSIGDRHADGMLWGVYRTSRTLCAVVVAEDRSTFKSTLALRMLPVHKSHRSNEKAGY